MTKGISQNDLNDYIKEYMAKSIFNKPIEKMDCICVEISGFRKPSYIINNPDPEFYIETTPIKFSKFEETEKSYKIAYPGMICNSDGKIVPGKIRRVITKKRGYIYRKDQNYESYTFFI